MKRMLSPRPLQAIVMPTRHGASPGLCRLIVVAPSENCKHRLGGQLHISRIIASKNPFFSFPEAINVQNVFCDL